MHLHTRGNAALAVLILLLAVGLAGANVALVLLAVQRATNSATAPTLMALYASCPPCLMYFVAAPLMFGMLFVLLLPQRTPRQATPARAEVKAPEKPAPPSPAPALRLLALLQQEARLVDFINEDIDAYSDEQVGTAVRSIHAACRKALGERIELRRIYAQEDGSQVTVEKGFDPAAVRLTGNVSGEPPFHGTLQHGGWRATKVSLPESPGGVDPAVIAPAEVEIG